MELAAYYVDLVNTLLTRVGMTHPEGHIHAGLLIYVTMQLLLRTRRASAIALQAVFGAEMVNETLQRAYYGSWRWEDTLGDIALTMLWPTILYTAARYRRASWSRRAHRRGDGVRIIARQSRQAALELAPEQARR